MSSRRRVLSLVAASLVAAPGCLSTSDSTDTPTTAEPTEREPIRGGADSVSVEQTVTDDADEPFTEWAHARGASVAAERVDSVLAERVPEAETLSVLVSTRGPQDGRTVRVALTTHLARDGNVLSEPSVSRETVASATPHSVTATLHFADRAYTDTYPVYVEERTIQNE